ncbi:MAG TPA: 3-deoxy-manno-octulosonate cytidylyltransferase [Candidatus Akkermansia intestinigallinarum]|uniref:3-deoxy-manno-octulosonate cytidylyltransferase n=1 Tax=Candidatus Akkermansia intestinigallinarum TaxID=2838431 RepID=A0A9D2AI30_9BACT|nr:3-deoxy-manno-octulosonate cytidylyltransferase [Candidatus Akkermansia intestinigallinarum]
MSHSVLLVIPARYASTRLPGKPLVKIAGKEMIRRVAEIAASICRHNDDCRYVVATDDTRITDFCASAGIPAVMTSESCRSGTERCWDAVRQCEQAPDFIINLQGDNPLCPPWVIQQLIDAWRNCAGDVFTPCIHLDWAEYDRLVESKKTTPYSGTTVLTDKDGYALAFSKNTIPAIRKPEKARAALAKSPVRRHVGLYAYTYEALKTYFELPESEYEMGCVEGLEQMRFLYNGMRVKMVEVDYRGRKTTSGVDSPEDVARVEAILAEYGEYEL